MTENNVSKPPSLLRSRKLKRLEPLVSKWRSKAQTNDSALGAGVPLETIETFTWLDGGYFLVSTYETTFGNPQGCEAHPPRDEMRVADLRPRKHSRSGTGEPAARAATYVAARGWTAVEYVDHGVSGTKDRRPALDRLVTDEGRRKFDALVT